MSMSTSTILSGATFFLATAGLLVSINNLRHLDLDCGIRSLSMAYVIFYILTVLAGIGTGGALFNGTVGLTLLTFMSSSLLVLGVLLFFRSNKILDEGLRRINYAMFGLFSLLTLVNVGYLFYQRQNIIQSQPANQIADYLRSRFGKPGAVRV